MHSHQHNLRHRQAGMHSSYLNMLRQYTAIPMSQQYTAIPMSQLVWLGHIWSDLSSVQTVIYDI
jgi:hypothetical protein